MASRGSRIGILNTDRLSDGLLIHFSDGEIILFHTQFLYDVRHQDGNVAITEDEEPANTQ